MFVGEQHAKTIFAQPFPLHAGIAQEILELGGQRTVLLHLHNHQIRHIRITSAEMVVKTDAEINGDALGFGLVHQSDALEGVLQPAVPRRVWNAVSLIRISLKQ